MRTACVLSAAALVFCAAMPLSGAEEQVDVLHLLRKAQTLIKSVDSYTAVFVKEELIDGKMRKPETVFMKFKRPFNVYLKWIKEPNKGREILYLKGKNNNNMKVHIGGLLNLFLPALNISPEHPQVLRNSRHPITHAGLENTIDSLIDQFELAKRRGHLQTIYHGKELLEGNETYRIERVLPKDKGYYCWRLVLNVDKVSGMPVRIQMYDWNNVLVERYTYIKITLNAPLTERDFDSRNKDYAFGIF
ncbi:MAG TPA: DUF1571 domain-containing protein [bacterium]|nr:DUF1571 domain-containing protein [bacterium]